MRRFKRKRQRKESKEMRKLIEKNGLDSVVNNIIEDSEMENTEENCEWLKNYVKKIAYK